LKRLKYKPLFVRDSILDITHSYSRRPDEWSFLSDYALKHRESNIRISLKNYSISYMSNGDEASIPTNFFERRYIKKTLVDFAAALVYAHSELDIKDRIDLLNL
jgi:hypothetical protein